MKRSSKLCSRFYSSSCSPTDYSDGSSLCRVVLPLCRCPKGSGCGSCGLHSRSAYGRGSLVTYCCHLQRSGSASALAQLGSVIWSRLACLVTLCGTRCLSLSGQSADSIAATANSCGRGLHQPRCLRLQPLSKTQLGARLVCPLDLVVPEALWKLATDALMTPNLRLLW